MPSLSELDWSDDVAQAAWIAKRLSGRGEQVATVFVPSGFEAYARILHPAEEPDRGGGRLVRWREVAAWSGLVLDPYAEFASIALPPVPVNAPPPWSDQGPRHGSLYPPDAAVVIDHLRRATTKPERCWFCLWDGYGWSSDAIPESVENGPRVRLPDRSYFLYRGAVDAALLGYPGEPMDHTANLWWPDDRAWCVASEIDLSSTYVAGSAALVSALVSEPAVEALEVSAGPRLFRSEPWIDSWVRDALDALLTEGHALVSTPLGALEAWFDRSVPGRSGSLRTRSRSTLGHGSEGAHYVDLSSLDDATIRRNLAFYLRWDIIALVGN